MDTIDVQNVSTAVVTVGAKVMIHTIFKSKTGMCVPDTMLCAGSKTEIVDCFDKHKCRKK